MIKFAVVDDKGNTPADDPKLEAYKYMAMLQFRGYRTSLTCQDGRYTVSSAGLAPITFFRVGGADDRPYKSKCGICSGTVGPFTGICNCI